VCRGVKIVQALLPAAVTFDADFHTSEDDLFATFEVDSKLDNISVVNGVRSALDTGTRESHVVEERARAGLDVFDVPLSACTPELAVAARDDF
jgi:hypothetical protein